ncbi:MAG: ABC-type lipoprotein export system ATPase subunit [Pseudohongiellaceae bacterium]|jgi:ABC-type lipoprotein export system ATPase subunit
MPAPHVVLCESLHKTYGQGASATTALSQVELQVAAGEVIALTGPSGSGKSTLLHLLGAMDNATSGTVLVGGTDLATLNDSGASAFRNEQLGFIFQFFHLMSSLSVIDNIALPSRLGGTAADVARQNAAQLADRVGIGELIERSPDTLSGGQRQRVAVARALINNPTLILADEPTGNLDHVSGAAIIELLAGLGHERGVAVIVATHDPAVTAASDREVRLVDGRVVRTT